MRVKITSRVLGKGGLKDLEESLQRFINDKTPVPDVAWGRISSIISEGVATHYANVIAPSIPNKKETKERKERDAAAGKEYTRGTRGAPLTAKSRFDGPGMHTGFLLQRLISPSKLPAETEWKVERISTNPRSFVEHGQFEYAILPSTFVNEYPARYFDPSVKIGAGQRGLSISSADAKLVRSILYDNAFRKRIAKAFRRGGK